MDHSDINSYRALNLKILQLKVEKERQEELLKYQFKEILHALSPSVILKNTLHDLAENKEVQFDLTKVSLNMIASFAISKVLGKNRSIKGFLSSLLLEKMAGSMINKNLEKIQTGFGKLAQNIMEKESN
jgi:hypothetical protein